MLVFLYSFSELGSSKRWVLCFVNVLVSAFVDGVVAVFSDLHIRSIFLVCLSGTVSLLQIVLLVVTLHHSSLVNKKVEAKVFLGGVEL